MITLAELLASRSIALPRPSHRDELLEFLALAVSDGNERERAIAFEVMKGMMK